MRKVNKNLLRNFLLVLLVLGVTSNAFAQASADLVIHSVEGKPQTGQYAYDVAINFSANQAGGDVIRDLKLSDLTLTEDGKQATVAGLELTDQDPINVVVVMDTSGSMQGVKMDAARSAASQFIGGLGKNDLAAIISFNSIVKTELGFTDILPDAREKVELLSAWEGAGTCLYDALFEAITLSATLPGGRRAIVTLTDGVDELPNGAKCSKHSEADVINLATTNGVGVPLYIVGLGNKVDAPGLQRMADATNGGYQFSSDEKKLQGLFANLLQQMRSQYRAIYVSTAAPGPHQLVLEAKISGQQIRKLHEFVLPKFPYKILIALPKQDQPIDGKTKFNVQVIGQGAPIARLEFFANGTSIGTVDSQPYELDWEPAPEASGPAKIEVVALDAKGNVLARSAFETVFATHAVIAMPESAIPTQATENVNNNSMANPRILIGLLVLALMIVVAVVIIFIQYRKKKERERLWNEKVQGTGAADVTAISGDDRTLDSFTTNPNTLGILTVMQSDDPVMQGQRFEITKSSTSLGRKSDNDIIFPKDSPVSRHHAVIEIRSGGLFLSEVMTMENGSSNRPAYGTYVNDKQVSDPVLLNNGDQVRLGKRLRLRFDGLTTTKDVGNTLDQYSGSGSEKTMDELGS